MINRDDIFEFRLYLETLTNAQLVEVWRKEYTAGEQDCQRAINAMNAEDEAKKRGMDHELLVQLTEE